MSEPFAGVAEAFRGVFADRLVGLAVYGSAVTGDAIPGLSDLDLYVVLTDGLGLEDAIALQRAMPEPPGISYAQATFHSTTAPEPYLVPGAFRVLAGTMPEEFLVDEERLRQSADDTLRELPELLEQDTRAWPGAIGEKRLRHVRLMTTRLKPAVRATLVQHGESPFSMWRASWDELVERWTDYDARRAKDLAAVLVLLRSSPIDAQRTGEALLRLLTSLASSIEEHLTLFSHYAHGVDGTARGYGDHPVTARPSRGCVGSMPDDADRLNRAFWDEVAGLHGQDGYYDTEAFLRGEPSLTRRELDEIRSAVGSVEGIDVLHLQCHFGLDSLSLARMGARVIGVDYSRVAIGRARALAATAGINATFVQADARALPPELRRGSDLVFASYGALIWVGDLAAWMETAYAALRPEGWLVVVDGHPIQRMVESIDPPRFRDPYHGLQPLVLEGVRSYAVPEALNADRIVEYPYGLGEVVTAAVRAGFRVDALSEYLDEEEASRGGILVEEDGRFVLLVAGGHLPTLFALRAQKPSSATGHRPLERGMG